MKKKFSLLLAILMLVALIPNTFAQGETVEAKKANQKMTLDGKKLKLRSTTLTAQTILSFAILL